MAKNSYPAECQRAINKFSPLAARLAAASDFTLDELRQEIAVAWLTGLDPSAAVPAAIGVRRLYGRDDWMSQDLHVAARRAENDENFEPSEEMPRPKARRGSVAAGVAADCAVGLRAAQKRLKRQRDAAEQGQRDLFGSDGVQNG